MTKNWDLFPLAEPATEDLANFSAYQIYNKFAVAGYGVLTGCVVSWTSTTRVDIASGTYTNNGAPRSLTATYISSIPAASAGNHRYDLIYIDGADDTVKRCAGVEGVPEDALSFLENYTPRPAEPTDTDWIPLAIIRVTENGLEETNFGTVVYATKSVVSIKMSPGFTVDDSTVQIVNGIISIKSDTVTKLDDLASPDSNTDLNATSTKHGLCPQLSNSATQFLNGAGAWTTPAPNHTTLGSIGTNTHAQIDTFISSKAAASGLASLDGSSKVVQDPANATATATASKIPIADGTGKLAAGWIPDISAVYATTAKGVTNGDTHDHVGGDGNPISAAATTFAATAKILGRKTAAAGAGEECSISEILDFIGSAVEGAVLYKGASTWTFLPKGASGQRLSQGTSIPEWITPSFPVAFSFGDGSAVLTATNCSLPMPPVALKIVSAQIRSTSSTGAPLSGSITCTLYKHARGAAIGTAVDSFVLSSASDLIETGLSIAVAASEWLTVVISGITTCKQVVLGLTLETT